MTTTAVLAMFLVGGGMALVAVGVLSRIYDRQHQLAELLDLPYGEMDVPVEAVTEHSNLVEGTIGLAGRMVDSIDAKGSLLTKLERSRLPVRPGEFVLFVVALGLIAGSLIAAITSNWVTGLGALVAAPFAARGFLGWRIARRRRAFEEQFPDALTLIASSLTAGHTFLRAIQMMCEESEPPLAEEFSRVVHETQLGDPLVDALGRMATRLDIRDVDWVVQAIRIQQTVGGKLADLLHTLADFIRAREEVRREVDVLTAEGKISAYVLGALPVFLLIAIQVINPGYMDPMFRGWGWVWLGGTGLSIVAGMGWILKMVKMEV